MAKETLFLGHRVLQKTCITSSGEGLQVVDWTHGLGRAYWGNLSVIR